MGRQIQICENYPMKLTPWILLLPCVLALSACGPARWSEHGNSSNEGDLGNNKPDEPVRTVESFLQDDRANKVDILIINDNSRSMDREQQKMSERFGSFVSAISEVDYQIAMTTTDIESKKWAQYGKIMEWNGTGTKILKPETPDADAAFRKTIVRNETIGCGNRNGGRDCPSGNEQPLKALMMAMDEMNGANAGLFRPGVDFVAVILSDEDEMSTGPIKATKPADVIEAFKNKFGETKHFAVHGIVIKPGDAACKALEDAEIQTGMGAAYGTHVDELARLTGGTTSSICDNDYAANLSAISEQVRKLLGTFELKSPAKPGSVLVTLVPAQNAAFHVDGNRVIFDTPPSAGTHIEISYVAL
jgi:hypothetical protein